MANKIKIAILIDQLVAGGVQKAAIEETIHLRRLGFDAKLIALMPAPNKALPFSQRAIPFEVLSSRYPKLMRYNFKIPPFHFLSLQHFISAFLAPFVVRPKDFDLVISHGTTTAFTAYFLSKFKATPYMVVVHDPMIYILEKVYKAKLLKNGFFIIRPTVEFIESHLLKSAKSIIVDSRVHANFIKEKYFIDPHVIYLGVNSPDKLKPLGNKFLAFSRWDFGKKPEIFLTLAKKNPRINFLLAGAWTSDSELEKFKQMIIKNNLSKNIELKTNVSNKQIPYIYSQASVFIHPHFEAFGLGALEAASYHLPVIIPKGSGVTEILEDGKDGIFPKNASALELTRAIKQFQNNPVLATNMGTSAYQKAKKFSWEIHTQKLADLIEKEETSSITIMESGHLIDRHLAGGGLVLEPLTHLLSPRIDINLIVSTFVLGRWQYAGGNIKRNVIKNNIFSNHLSPLFVFWDYIFRAWDSYSVLKKIDSKIVVSCEDFIPDIWPPFIQKIKGQKFTWIIWMHHIIPPPHKRPGNFVVNAISYLLQRLGLMIIKSKGDIIICNNNDVLKTLQKNGFDKSKLQVISVGLDLSLITKHKISNFSQYDAVYLGRFHASKGTFDLVPIWKLVTRQLSGAKLVVMGTGNENKISTLRNQIYGANLKNNITLLISPTDEVKYNVLKNSKIFLFTDYEGGFSLASAEAMASGLPVVANKLPIFGMVYKKGFISAPQGEQKIFSQKIIRLLTHPRERLKLSKDAQAQSLIFDRQKSIKKFTDLIQNEIAK